MKIRYTDWGIACRIDKTIYINRELLWHPKLYKKILEHEQNHTNVFTIADIALDLRNKELKNVKKEYWNFILTHPKSWTEFLPFGIYNKKIVFNPILCALYLDFVLAITLIIIFT